MGMVCGEALLQLPDPDQTVVRCLPLKEASSIHGHRLPLRETVPQAAHPSHHT